MSGTLNKVMLIGHLGDEVKMHYFEGGNCIGRFPLATKKFMTYCNNIRTDIKMQGNEYKTKSLPRDAYRGHMSDAVINKEKTGWTTRYDHGRQSRRTSSF